MIQALSVGGRTLVLRLPAGGESDAVDLSMNKGWSLQVDGDFGGGTLEVLASNNGQHFYSVDTAVAPGLYKPDDDYCWYKIKLVDASEKALVTATIYTY